jgi:TnpA family transposase
MAIYNSLIILNRSEIEEIFDIPKIDPQDRELFFEITPEDAAYLEGETQIHNKVDYILQAGYFRACHKFYKFEFNDIQGDAQYILNRYYSKSLLTKPKASKDKHYDAQKFILKTYEYKRYDGKFTTELTKQAKRLSKRDLTPRFVFDGLLDHCENHQIIRPEYSTLQTLVSGALLREENRLSVKLAALLDKSSRIVLDDLIAKGETVSELALLKKDPKGLITTEMEAELSKQKNLTELFEKSKHMIPKLDISRQNLQYYSDLCDYYDTYQLREFNQKKSRLCMICLIWQRFIKLNDHLTTFFTHKTKNYGDAGAAYGKECIVEAKLGSSADRKIAGKMLNIVDDENVPASDIRPECYNVVGKDKFQKFTAKLIKPDFDQKGYEWDYYTIENGSIKRNLRSIFMSLNFKCAQYHKLEEAINYAKEYLASVDKTKDPIADSVPLTFMSATTLKYVQYKQLVKTSPTSKRRKNVKYINIKRYEMALYQSISSALNAGNIFIPDSVNYRSLEDELIPLAIWEKDKTSILKSLSDCINTMPIEELLKSLNLELSGLYKHVNKRIKSGENKYIKIDENKLTWRLPYKKEADAANNPYYEKFVTTGITNVMDFSAEKTNFYDSFSHILHKGSRSKPKPQHIKGFLVSQGEGIGHKRVAESSDVSYQNLTDIEGKFIRVETLVEAGDIVIDEIAKLPIFKYYNLSDYGIHASLDGQKLETKYQTILSRYSTKYFGYGKGVVSYSLIANHLPVSTKVIGANEHESHYVLDIVYNNSSNLNIKSVSGDMHSVNRVNFGLMYLFDYEFMPRFTSLHLKADKNLVSFKDMNSFNNDLIKASSEVNSKIIIDEWSNIQRILASIARKDASQSTIIRKLSSYSAKNSTLKALIEFDKIIMSIYMLKYIDDIQLRRRVHRALNRGEAFHQLRSALLQVSGKKILGKSENALEVSNQCNRLLTCCIIYYNATLLSELLTQAEAAGDVQLTEKIKQFSPVAWQHIGLLGNFVFCSNAESLDIKGIVEMALQNKEENKSDETLVA